ncbi:MAG: hypothetical protein CSA65_08635 [Proteobacteria bacterium]|nr:MAG: hypothetical protein CSB49_07025 [Pseudomonadota bacterium]PIE17552.1 MAG: hypothetical protein CSA65_08635 [Pseudomonadota bacterium]
MRGTSNPARRWALVLALLCPPIVAALALPYLPGCVMLGSVGVPCPGCGLGRAVDAALHGQPLTALGHYPALLPLAISYALALVAAARWARARGRSIALERWAARMGLGGAAVAMITWLGRALG